MSGLEFFQTRMGQRFFEVTMPKVADELAGITAALLDLSAAVRASSAPSTSPADVTAPPAAPAPAATPVLPWAAISADRIREHLRGTPVPGEGEGATAFDEIAASALGVALRAAYHAGAAATLRALRAESADGSPAPR